ncbi:MAG: hypothetical protein R3A52_29435 [Polyangiales bacterium]
MRASRSPITLGLSLALAPLAASAQGTPWAHADAVAPNVPPAAQRSPAVDHPAGWPRYATRPLVLQGGRIGLLFGLGFASTDLPNARGGDAGGLGFHFAVIAGLGRGFEVDAGTGLRLGDPVSPDRFARIGRDEVFQMGNGFFANPYLRLRWAFADDPSRIVHAGVELMGVAPLGEDSAWSVGAGLPVHFVFNAARLRIETGVFYQRVLSAEAQVRGVLYFPLRVIVHPEDRIFFGLTSGFTAGNPGEDDPRSPLVSLGLLAGVRLSPRIDALAQVVLPAVQPYGVDAVGVGISLLTRVR